MCIFLTLMSKFALNTLTALKRDKCEISPMLLHFDCIAVKEEAHAIELLVYTHLYLTLNTHMKVKFFNVFKHALTYT